MEDAGVIEGQVAILNPRAVGLMAAAYVQVTLTDHSETSLARFEAFVQAHDQIVECAILAGEADYLLKVMARDPEDLERFLMQQLRATGLVRDSKSSFVLRRLKARTALPLPDDL